MENELRRTWAEVSLDALEHNYRTLRKHVGEQVKFLGVVKADAYGHGSVQVSKLLQRLGADYLAVSSIHEAMELRENGITMPLLILGHTPKDQVVNLIRYNITQTVSCQAKALNYSEEAVRLGATLKVHIKVDTGMSRLGFLCESDHFDEGVAGIVHACTLPGLAPEGIFTHFAVADEEDAESQAYTQHQLDLFLRVIDAVQLQWGHTFAIRHCANTGATALYPQAALDMVRPGLLLYGYSSLATQLGLHPAMTIKCAIQTIKHYPAGTKISYGGTYTTTRPTRVGVLPYGYADGFLRALSNNCEVLTADGLVPQIGRICMDMCMVDLTDAPNVGVGDEVEVWGPNNPIERLAEAAGTIPYELVCAVSKRVPRVYLQNGKEVFRELMLRM
ncbi:MAG: alanine racemase [Coriobacteriia bacterium]|nr:alanine racemase [Coriobacteriia bacterium]